MVQRVFEIRLQVLRSCTQISTHSCVTMDRGTESLPLVSVVQPKKDIGLNRTTSCVSNPQVNLKEISSFLEKKS